MAGNFGGEFILADWRSAKISSRKNLRWIIIKFIDGGVPVSIIIVARLQPVVVLVLSLFV